MLLDLTSLYRENYLDSNQYGTSSRMLFIPTHKGSKKCKVREPSFGKKQ